MKNVGKLFRNKANKMVRISLSVGYMSLHAELEEIYEMCVVVNKKPVNTCNTI